jgi:hypothetical protein
MVLSREIIREISVFLSFLIILPAAAEEFIVTDTRSITNGGNFLFQGDTLIVEQQGAIRVSDPFGEAINANADFVTLINRGVIATTGEFATAIAANSEGFVFQNFGTLSASSPGSGGLFSLKSNALIRNLGTIETEDVGADAVQISGDASTVENSGSIVTQFDVSAGILVQSSLNRIDNAGSVSTFGRNSNGIFIDAPGNRIQNTGTIRAREQFSRGIYAFGNDNRIASSGLIASAGTDAEALLAAGNGNTIENAGTIISEGAFSGAVTILGDDNTLTNSGAIVSTSGHAVGFQGTGNALRLSGPAFLGGLVILGNGTSVHVNTTGAGSVLWDFSNGVLDGPVVVAGNMPHFYNPATRQFAIYDPTGLTRSVDALADTTRVLAETLRDGPLAAGPASGGFWVSGIGGSWDHSATGSANAAGTDLAGFAAGYSWQTARRVEMSAMAGYLATGIDIAGRIPPGFPGQIAHRIRSHGWFAGLGGRGNVGGLVIDAGVITGVLSNDSQRFVNDNIAASGLATVSGAYDSWFVSPEIGVSVNRDLGRGLVLTPATRLRLTAQSFEAHEETGATAGRAIIGARTAAWVESSTELGLTWTSDFGSIGGQLGFLARGDVGDNTAAVSVLGTRRQVAFASGDSSAFFAGAEAKIAFGPDAWLSFSGKAYFGGDFDGQEGRMDLRIRY